ncbi:MAG: hypothetical protein ACP5XB_04440 [Isosphaeraceae bacterium]
MMAQFFKQRSPAEIAFRPARNVALNCEQLEGRALMNFSLLSSLVPAGPAILPPLAPSAVSSELPKNASGRLVGLYELSLTQHPPYQSVVGSEILKAPMFYAAYTGPKHADLDILGANATINPGQDIQFTGRVLGPIDMSQTDFYSFLVNRGGASSPGPLKGQPRMVFDALVQVTTGSHGFTATVALLNSQGLPTTTTELPPDLVRIVGTQVNVTVPLDLLPSSGSENAHGGHSHYSYAFSTSVAGTSESDIAGFAPEHTMAPITISNVRHR